MQLTEQQRAELERRVQRVKRLSNSYQPVYDTCVPSREWAQAVTEALEALASALQGKEGGEAVSFNVADYLRRLADWIHHEAFYKLPDELEEKADEVRELAQTLESGVVVVPVEEARLAADAVSVYLSMGLQVTQAEIERMKRFLARLQNVETPSETRITVTIDVQTLQDYHDRRVIEVEPGIGWPERMAPEVLKAALEMEEQFLRRGLQQNGGARR